MMRQDGKSAAELAAAAAKEAEASETDALLPVTPLTYTVGTGYPLFGAASKPAAASPAAASPAASFSHPLGANDDDDDAAAADALAGAPPTPPDASKESLAEYGGQLPAQVSAHIVRQPLHKSVLEWVAGAPMGFFIATGFGAATGLDPTSHIAVSVLSALAPYANGRLINGAIGTWFSKPHTQASDYRHLIGKSVGVLVAGGVGFFVGHAHLSTDAVSHAAEQGSIGYMVGTAAEQLVNRTMDYYYPAPRP